MFSLVFWCHLCALLRLRRTHRHPARSELHQLIQSVCASHHMVPLAICLDDLPTRNLIVLSHLTLTVFPVFLDSLEQSARLGNPFDLPNIALDTFPRPFGVFHRAARTTYQLMTFTASCLHALGLTLTGNPSGASRSSCGDFRVSRGPSGT